MGMFCEELVKDHTTGELRKCNARALKETQSMKKPRCVLHSGKFDPSDLGRIGGLKSKRKSNPEFTLIKALQTPKQAKEHLGEAIYKHACGMLDNDSLRAITTGVTAFLRSCEQVDISFDVNKIITSIQNLDNESGELLISELKAMLCYKCSIFIDYHEKSK